MKASRLLSILMLLQSRGRLTAAALAEALEVSERTVLRDIDQLSAAGVPLWGERGRSGGFQLREGWSTQLTGMTEPEANALLLAGLPGPATELGLGAAAASARLKLLASLPTGWREQADRVGERLHIDPVDWYRAQDTPKYLREVADAVWHARRLKVHYDSWRGPIERELEPLGLVLKAGAWYTIARSTGQPGERTYRLASLLDLQATSKTFQRPRKFSLAEAWRASAARFEAELRTLQAHVRVSPRALGWLRNGRIPAVQVPGALASTDGWQEVLMPIESIEHGARQLLGWGAEVEALAPVELRALVLSMAQAVVARLGASSAAS
ncbi:MAG TPA: WYL domain-containing protein [Ideonella sp.]|uniref:helix-turn-helix transcriptional regulator n=1 Tax=Ideonella sp. TaxID=1929293 RepID=UPI002C4B1E16|nr:WYL domain-containing protein [Ideonella sp.]HSI47510.1 WYL domain-containing protein [Ideonella sp.]